MRVKVQFEASEGYYACVFDEELMCEDDVTHLVNLLKVLLEAERHVRSYEEIKGKKLREKKGEKGEGRVC